MAFLQRLNRLFDRIASVLVISLMAVMGVVAFTAVVFRFVLHSPLTWTEESARYMMIWVTFMGAGLAMRQRRHIGVTIVVQRLPASLQRTVNMFAEIVMIAFMGVLLYQGLNLTYQLRTQVSPAMNFPMIIPYLAVPAGALYLMTAILEFFLDRSAGALSTADTELERQNYGEPEQDNEEDRP
ncbi:MAG: TRAP transporter small permease [Synergistales bacterium]|nr:TRAP transporter small permease [Synergistales bacterium]